MHRRLLAALTALCLLLPASGCGGSGAEMEFEELRGKLGGAAVELGALVTDCSGGGGGTEYRLRCVSGAEGSELEVLDAGAGGENPCALTALPLLCSALRSAHVALAWTEGSESVLSLVPEDEYGITLRLGEDGAPVYAEFTGTESGETLLVCRIESFAIV